MLSYLTISDPPPLPPHFFSMFIRRCKKTIGNIRENEDDNKIINSIIKFEFVQSTKSKNIDQNEPETELELLAIDLFKREHNFEITLLFSKNRFITLTSEIIEAVLEDQKIENDKSN